MPQIEKSVTSPPKEKRQYRKGHPLTDAEKQRQSVARKRESLKEVKVFLEPRLKTMLLSMCEQDGLTQAQVLSILIEREAQQRKIG